MRETQSFPHLGRWLAVLGLLMTLCAGSVAMTTSAGPEPESSSGAFVDESSTDAGPLSTIPISAELPAQPTTTTPIVAPSVDRDVLDGISMTSVPDDVIVPTNAGSLDAATNPINGRRGGLRRAPADLDCETMTITTCLTSVLDNLGFDVTDGSTEDRHREVQRATAVVQLDAGLPMTGVPDDALNAYLGIDPDASLAARADETRQLGTSAEGRPITAYRYGDGPRIVLVVGQTHGDEEGGLRVLLRVRSRPLPDGITLWVVPTMNPDGLILDTRFLANGTDPNRMAPSQLEQQIVYEFAVGIHPSLTVWYHQNYGWVGGSGASASPAKRYQEVTGLGTLKRSGDCVVSGFMWCPIDDAVGSSSILVELPDVLTPADVQIHARALLEVAAGDGP